MSDIKLQVILNEAEVKKNFIPDHDKNNLSDDSEKLKCPFCQQELEICGKYTDGTSKVWCSKCNLFGDSKLFEELITTRKALDVIKKEMSKETMPDFAVIWDALKGVDNYVELLNIKKKLKEAIDGE